MDVRQGNSSLTLDYYAPMGRELVSLYETITMSFISLNFNPDLKGVKKALERIANVLERIAMHSGIPLEDPPAPNDADKSHVSYTTDRSEVRKELAKELGIDDVDDHAEEDRVL